jgi:multiple sugar transport system substrate-binding protein
LRWFLKFRFKKVFSISNFPLWTVLFAIAVLAIYFYINEHARYEAGTELIDIYFAADISYAHQKVIDEFNKEYHGKIKVITIDLPFKKFSTNERKELLARTLRSNSDRLDVFAVDQIWVPRFAKWSAPITNFLPEFRKNDFLKYALETCYYDNKLLAVPLNIDVNMMYYRKDLLEKIPAYDTLKSKLMDSITWNEFLDLSKKFTENINPFYIFPADDYEGLVVSFMDLILSQDRNYFKNNNFNFNTPIAKKALKLLYDFINVYHISPESVVNFDEASSYKYFIEKNGVFLWGWPSYEKDDRNLYKSTPKDKLLVKAALPHFNNLPPTTILGGWNIMVSKYSKKKNQISEFLKFITGKKAQEMLYVDGAYLPILNAFYNGSVYLKKYPDLIFKKKLLDTGVHRPFFEDYTRISDIISFYINKALKKEISLDDALRKITTMIKSNKILIK